MSKRRYVCTYVIPRVSVGEGVRKQKCVCVRHREGETVCVGGVCVLSVRVSLCIT